jgi:hypothetical protein
MPRVNDAKALDLEQRWEGPEPERPRERREDDRRGREHEAVLRWLETSRTVASALMD